MPYAERPLAFRPTSLSSLARYTMANMSPPSAVLCGSMTVSTAAVATAASIALPPFFKMSSPASAASGWLVATIPRWPIVADRLVSSGYGEPPGSCVAAWTGQSHSADRTSVTTNTSLSRRYMKLPFR